MLSGCHYVIDHVIDSLGPFRLASIKCAVYVATRRFQVNVPFMCTLLHNWLSPACDYSYLHVPVVASTLPRFMSHPLHTVLPSTPPLDKLVADVVLGDATPLKKGNTVLHQYTWSPKLERDIKEEIFRRACIRGAPQKVLLIKA
jgi:hypothetical protein